MRRISRRKLLQGIGTATVGASSLTGCLGQGSEGPLDSITVAYVPIYPNMQHFIMQEEGYYDDLPVDVSIERFSNGPNVVKAFASGDVDVAVAGITPAMVLLDRGTDVNVLAANGRNAFKALATNEVAEMYERSGAEAFGRFENEKGRKVRFGTPPDGSVPDVVLRYWLDRDLGLGELESVVSKSKIEPARSVQTIRSGEIDATMIMEPFASMIAGEEGFGELAWSGEILPGHPMTGLFVNGKVLGSSELSRSLVEKHVQATRFVEEKPQTAASHAASVIGSGVTTDLAVTALESRASDFISDPHAVTDQTATMSEYVASVGNIDEPVSVDDLFAFEPYDSVQ
ncbi:ABC transporter substrate-binding protein [Haladaptatus sp. F3-133]|jgi:NitT/TauT family transport system substrate-binding protein|uniref:ABC transporter substrate-binding protein n=1 Tax=Halorutilus salinus TaxID=2487751 RepID=A0A9Q4GG27_9EURY|nr:ABC transporter substrate-binding protein [Halorutilus salinus]MCX2818734.1 ABC transporter substrate-binding protein [Halorutilus salinus]